MNIQPAMLVHDRFAISKFEWKARVLIDNKLIPFILANPEDVPETILEHIDMNDEPLPILIRVEPQDQFCHYYGQTHELQ